MIFINISHLRRLTGGTLPLYSNVSCVALMIRDEYIRKRISQTYPILPPLRLFSYFNNLEGVPFLSAGRAAEMNQDQASDASLD